MTVAARAQPAPKQIINEIKRLQREPKDMSTVSFVNRIGPHHFAHLRAVSEGLQLVECAERYLGIEHGHQARLAHEQVVDAARAVARRSGKSAWRLIGLTLRSEVAVLGGQPTLEQFCDARGLDGWSEAEIVEMYREAYPTDRKMGRNDRMRVRQRDLLRELEALAAVEPQSHDSVAGWFDDATAPKLIAAGIVTLDDLFQKIGSGGVWFRTMPGVGKTKASRIERQLRLLLPNAAPVPKIVFNLQGSSSAELAASMVGDSIIGPAGPLMTQAVASQPSALPSLTALPAPRLVQASTDLEAVEAWIDARSGSTPTSKSYRREAQRLILWLQHSSPKRGFSQMGVEDCTAYQRFLADIPAHWISRNRVAPGEPGWAPFRGQLDSRSQKQALIIISSLFLWLNQVGYLQLNPWALVNKKIGDDRSRKLLDSKSFSESAISGFVEYLGLQPPSPSRDRMRFIILFLESVGLRSAELLSANLSDFELHPEGWVLQVFGKGAKNRIASVPAQAYDALQVYLALRGLTSIQSAPPDAPLIASTRDPLAPIGYQALYEHVRSWVSRYVAASDLPNHERMRIAQASAHWLRHTFGTRSVARGVPTDVIQAQMGHASIETTTSIYGRAPLQRRAVELEKAFPGSS